MIRCYYCDAPETWPDGLNRPPVIRHLRECPLISLRQSEPHDPPPERPMYYGELEADMANRPPAFTGGTQANQWQADGSMRRTLRPQGETTRSGSPSSQAAWAMPRCPK